MSVAQMITNLRSEIEEYEMMQSGKTRMNQGGKFLAVMINGRFGKKFPISTRAIISGFARTWASGRSISH
jgi:hypothetical protein